MLWTNTDWNNSEMKKLIAKVHERMGWSEDDFQEQLAQNKTQTKNK